MSRSNDSIRGLDPDLPIEEFMGSFTFEEAQRSLFLSTRSNPFPVLLQDTRQQEPRLRIPVVIDTARSVTARELIGDEEAPEWFFAGWVVPQERPGTVEGRVRIAVMTLNPHHFGEDDLFLWQMERDPTTEA